MLAGSKGRSALRPSARAGLAAHRDVLLQEGIIKIGGEEIVFLKDHLLSSPSAAGSVLVGGDTNGRANWRDGQGRSINDLEQMALSAAEETHLNESSQ
ncbi:DUF4357 domain-containing protein [Mycobacterium sp. DL440]|uniref:DUF4357 domain-containing protein n=1 Tax=Mycobacterium sp. DL440 TaxID=2675523 RepID=UPI001FBA466E|nr:DUF4357 domain-containing protein [Mycobacterium sp. DL440]